MRQVTVQKVISAPREEIFDFVADLSNRPAYCDHYLDDFRLARVNSRGVGAAARFRLDGPLANEWAGLSITVCDRPRRIVEEGRVGRLGRSRFVVVYDFLSEASGTTRVEMTAFAEPATVVDRLKHLGAAGWVKRKSGRALDRLRAIFEEAPRGELPRATVAGHDAGKAPRFGDHVVRRGAAAADR